MWGLRGAPFPVVSKCRAAVCYADLQVTPKAAVAAAGVAELRVPTAD
jgi:hypothetical protein